MANIVALVVPDQKRIENELRSLVWSHFNAGVHPTIIKKAWDVISFDACMVVDQDGQPIVD